MRIKYANVHILPSLLDEARWRYPSTRSACSAKSLQEVQLVPCQPAQCPSEFLSGRREDQ